MEIQVQRINELDAYFASVANRLATIAKTAVEKRGVFNLVLSGGRTPQGLYQYMASAAFQARFPWQQTHFFWGDERCLPSQHPDNNANMALTSMLFAMQVPSKNIHSVPVGKGSPQDVAVAYADSLAEYFQIDIRKGDYPVFDMVLLGLGSDGHTASLFPAALDRLQISEEWIDAVHAPQGSPPGWRVTMTLKLINHAQHAMFLSIDPGKLPLIQEILDHAEAARQRYPAAWIAPADTLAWMIYPGGAIEGWKKV